MNFMINVFLMQQGVDQRYVLGARLDKDFIYRRIWSRGTIMCIGIV